MIKKLALFVALIVIMTISLQAEDLQSTLESLSGAAASSYVNPIVSAFGSNMNGGWFHKAPKAKLFGWDLEFGMVAMGTMFSDSDKDFDVNGSFQFNEDQARVLIADYEGQPYYDALLAMMVERSFNVRIKGPTIVGAAYDSLAVLNSDGTNPTSLSVLFTGDSFAFDGIPVPIVMPSQIFMLGIGGLMEDIPALPLAAPQLSIGTIAGTKLAFRYLPDTEISKEIGKVKYMGYGIQHNPAYWLPFKIPVDVGLSYFTQSLDVGKIIETDATTFGLNVSKTFGLKLMSVTPYAGISAESSKMKFHYDYQVSEDTTSAMPNTIKVKFDVEGKNTSRITLGTSFRLGVFNLNFDYNVAKYPSATMGFMLNLGW